MATTHTTNPVASEPTPPAVVSAALLVSLVSFDHESFEHLLANLAVAFPGESLIVATPDGASSSAYPSLQVVAYTPTAQSDGGWTLTAADFVNAHELATQYHPRAILQLGAGAQSLEPRTLFALAAAVLDDSADLATPCYDLPPNAGLVNSAILYPLSRALFGTHARFPLALDLGLSARACERLATVAQRATAANQPDALMWPLIECAAAAFTIKQVDAGTRTLPQPPTPDLNAILAQIVSSLFTEIEARAAFWQRARVASPARAITATPAAGRSDLSDAQPMIESFRLAYSNLHEIWSLVLPPHSLLGLKRLSAAPVDTFNMPDSLWARIVYDFLLAFRLRTLNRGHLLGALTPLYLAWVASHVVLTHSGRDPEQHIEAVAAAFEADKPYLVSRWRWPDRFNP